MRRLWFDTETFSSVPIAHGTHAYVAAEDFEILMATWAWDEGPVLIEEFPTPEFLQALVDRADEIVIHKSDFDRAACRRVGVDIPIEKTHDTMVRALMHSLEGGLDKLCDVLRVPTDKAKLKSGKRLIHKFTKPQPKNQKIRRCTKETHPVEWAEFCEYAKMDIVSMREVYKRIPFWNWKPEWIEEWHLDQRINERGFQVDVDLAHAALRAAERASAKLARQAKLLSGGEEQADGSVTGAVIQSTTQRDVTLQYLRSLGVQLDDLKGGTVEAALKEDNVPEDARAILKNRLEAAATSPAKYKALLRSVSADGRLRGTAQFCGAMRTGRDAGRIFQPTNLPRPTLKQPVIDFGIEAMKANVEDVFFDDVMELCVSAIRGCLIAAPGKKLVAADLSNIEGRFLAWLAKEEWKLQAFRDFDAGIGPDLYKVTAGAILGKPPEKVTKDERQGQGKVPELACLGSDTRVLTHVGIKTIVEVLPTDLLWDGFQWVKHGGLIDRGERETLNFDGLTLTPDHLVRAGPAWRPMSEVVSSPVFLCLSRETGMASLRLLAASATPPGGSKESACVALAERSHTSFTSPTSALADRRAATHARTHLRPDRPSSGTVTPTSSQTTRIADASATESRLATIAAITPTTRPMRTTAAEGSRSTSLGARIVRSFSDIWSSFQAGMIPSSKWTGKTSIEATSRGISGSSPDESIGRTNAPSETCNDASMNLRHVYDIAHAGPRNAFTVLTDTGAFLVHNCGYQGSVGAFNTMGAVYGVYLPEDEALEIVRAWRKRHPNTVNLWYDTERAAISALRNPGEVFRCGRLAFQYERAWLRMRLPSGRYLCYPQAEVNGGRHVCDKCEGHGTVLVGGWQGEEPPSVAHREVCNWCEGSGIIDLGKPYLSYMGVDQYTRQWKRLQTYGGKTIENADQAGSRDVFYEGIKRAEAAGYEAVLRVHDELVCEVPDTPEYSAEHLASLLAAPGPHTPGLPLAAAGFEAYRYKKED